MSEHDRLLPPKQESVSSKFGNFFRKRAPVLPHNKQKNARTKTPERGRILRPPPPTAPINDGKYGGYKKKTQRRGKKTRKTRKTRKTKRRNN